MASLYVADQERDVIPRWREYSDTATAGELRSVGEKRDLAIIQTDFELKTREWLRQKSLTYATDLLGTAIVLGREDEARDAASFIVGHPSPGDVALQVAQRVLQIQRPLDNQVVVGQMRLGAKVAILRRRLREFPGNPIAWTDLARALVSTGKKDASYRAIQVARTLAPNSRFVLRSAARLLIHLDLRDEAHHMLRRSPLLSHDPWMTAAEIAVAMAAGSTPRAVKVGKQMLGSGHLNHRETAELASAMATLEYRDGSQKLARRLLREALRDPNDNTLAQAEWLAPRLSFFSNDLEEKIRTNDLSFEARALEGYRVGDWRGSLSAAILWLEDQPFATRPAIHASYVASIALEDFATAEQVVARGLVANPSDPTLLNNRAFARISMGRYTEAAEDLKRAKGLIEDRREQIAIVATAGLLAFRTGAPLQGRKLYESAIRMAEAAGLPKYIAIARINLALESLREGAGEAGGDVARAEDVASQSSDADVRFLVERLRSKARQV